MVLVRRRIEATTRCQGISLPAVRPADRIVPVSVAVGPRGCARGISHALSSWCHPAYPEIGQYGTLPIMRIGNVTGVRLAFIEQPEAIEKILTHLGVCRARRPSTGDRCPPILALTPTVGVQDTPRACRAVA